MTIVLRQIKRIHVLKSALKLSDESYLDILSGYNVSSSKYLEFAEAAELIVKLESMITRMRVNNTYRPQTQKKFDDLGNRPGMASPAQLRKIDVMWRNVSRQTDQIARERARDSFIYNICKIKKIEWLEPRHVKKVIRALEKMGELPQLAQPETVIR